MIRAKIFTLSREGASANLNVARTLSAGVGKADLPRPKFAGGIAPRKLSMAQVHGTHTPERPIRRPIPDRNARTDKSFGGNPCALADRNRPRRGLKMNVFHVVSRSAQIGALGYDRIILKRDLFDRIDGYILGRLWRMVRARDSAGTRFLRCQ